jgi:hypothetical protein
MVNEIKLTRKVLNHSFSTNIIFLYILVHCYHVVSLTLYETVLHCSIMPPSMLIVFQPVTLNEPNLLFLENIVIWNCKLIALRWPELSDACLWVGLHGFNNNHRESFRE